MSIYWLMFAHFIADWGLQPEWMATNKGKYWFVMFAHCMIWTGCVCMALEYAGLMHWSKIIFLFVIHYCTDKWKCSVYAKKPFCEQTTNKHMYIDQLIHIAQIVLVGVF